MKTLNGTLLQPQSPTEYTLQSNTTVRIDNDGRIAEVGHDKTAAGDVVGGADCWILPGFIDAHLHLPQWDRRGIDGYSIREWHEKVVYPAEARFADVALAELIAESFVDGVIGSGTTTVAAYGSPFGKATHRCFEVFARRGLRAIYGRMLNDVHCPDELSAPADRQLDEAREIAAKWHGAENGRLSYAFSPRQPRCCSEKLMRGAAALAEMVGCYIQTHAGESHDEVHAVRESYPDSLDDIDVFAEMGLLTKRTLLGHGVVLDHDERHQIVETQTTLVHCPTANLFLEAGLMDYVTHRKAGVRFALGSSIASGPDAFMPHVAVACLQTAKALKVHAIPRRAYPVPQAAEAWWLLTRGGAEALSMGDRVGTIAAGYEADCIIVRPEPWIAELPPENQASALLYTLKPEQIEHVFIAGKRVGPKH
ncbi:MAG: amidohydrolase family protein [Phycisphaerales bacterium]|nr:amidohydrolase family protein [Phycisphaerales bacterium]